MQPKQTAGRRESLLVTRFGLATTGPRNRRSWLLFGFSLAAFALAISFLVGSVDSPEERITLTAGPESTTRTLFAKLLAVEITARGIDTRVVPAGTTLEIYRLVDTRAVDFALVNGALDIEQFTHVREVMSLYNEALHLLVKPELADAVEHSFGALSGRTVNLGAPGSASAGLAEAVLTLAEIPPATASGSDGYLVRQIDPDVDLARHHELANKAALPDAVFHLATLPSTTAHRYVQSADYRLVSVPFADALRLSAIYLNPIAPLPEGEIERRNIFETLIPPFTYQIEPAVPAKATPTIGTPVYLVVHDSVSNAAVERVMEAVLDSGFARLHEPPVDRSVLERPPRIPLHPGSSQFRLRSKPLLTADDMEALSNSLSVIGALIGATLFLWQSLRQRRESQRQHVLRRYLLKIADVERRIAEVESSASLDLEILRTLQRDVLKLKGDALDDFTAGAFAQQEILFDLLGSINAAQEHIGQLLMHLRETIETQAEIEGKAADELWDEASGIRPPVQRD